MSNGETNKHADPQPQPQHHHANGVSNGLPHANKDAFTESRESAQEARVEEDCDVASLPSKKRKFEDSITTQRSSSRATSPPWKKVAVEGPTSFMENGRRKSSRTNAVPLELQPQGEKRLTRAAQTESALTKACSKGGPLQNGHPATHAVVRAQPEANRPKSSGKTTASPSSNSIRENVLLEKSPRQHRRKPSAASPFVRPHAVDNISPATRKPRPSTAPTPHRPQLLPLSSHVAPETANDSSKPASASMTMDATPVRPARLRLRVRPPTIPVRNPQQVLQPRKFRTFADWLAYDDPLAGEEEEKVDGVIAHDEANIRRRIAEAATRGGLLGKEQCSIHKPAEHDGDQKLRQYGHWDHVVSQAMFFRKLMLEEQKEHKSNAKKLALAAAAEWRRRRPKTTEDIQAEQIAAERAVIEARRKQIVRDIQQKWDLVTAEVNRRKFAKWEQQQQALQRQQLNDMLEHSTQLLDKRITGEYGELSDADMSSNEDFEERDDDEPEIASTDDEHNMSSNGSDGSEVHGKHPVDEDERLTVEELRRKYAALPDVDSEPDTDVDIIDGRSEDGIDQDGICHDEGLDVVPPELEEVDEALMDDSADSTDMSDDMGSSDSSDSSDSSEESAPGSPEESGDEGLGLLGFLPRSEVAAVSTGEIRVQEPELQSGKADDGRFNSGHESLIEGDDMNEYTLGGSSSHRRELHVSEVVEFKHASAARLGVTLDEVLPDAPPSVGEDLVAADRDSTSLNHSSQLSPRTSTTKRSEIDSASSVELQGRSQNQSLVTTPQPSATLKTKVPFLLRGTLREYQHYGLDWLAGLYASNQNGILADEMGLGKTIQTIALLAHLAIEHEVWGPHLVVVPTSVMLNWEMEFKKWCPGFKILTYYGTQEERKQKRKGWMDDDRWNVCITSYQLVLQDAQAFKRRNWHYLILDEAHNIKNFRSQRWQTMLTFKTRARLLLTGTPVQNNLTELWSLVYFTHPDTTGFADLKEFSEIFRRPVEQILEQGRETMDDEAKAMVTKLHAVLRPRLLRRLKADVEKQMPGKYEHIVYCRLSKRQRQLYDGYMGLAKTRESFASGNYLSIINCLMQLRKVCNHPDLFETRPIVTSFAMPRSAVATFEIQELLVRRRLLKEDPMERVSLDFLNFKLVANESRSAIEARRSHWLRATRTLEDLFHRQSRRINPVAQHDFTSMQSTMADLEWKAKKSRLEELRSCMYWTTFRTEAWPVYGKGLVDRLTLSLEDRPLRQPPKQKSQLSEWYLNTCLTLRSMISSIAQRSEALYPLIEKFSCVTPAVVAPDMVPLTLTTEGVSAIQSLQQKFFLESDPYHHSRIRLSIAFPDARLLQYDCGKLQRLDKLLRELQAGGHRALIFTQMTRVLDILEQFLNIHGHRYLRLDGATNIEQRQILTDRFNNDPRILVFILSSRSGGLGINLTGADTVIFYDLDWNPAMDKQCQDRCHRIGQTRDVHIYRFVSEYTIEANILRKSNQKRMLDDVVIQEGEFTTDYFNKRSYRDMLDDGVAAALRKDDEANAAVDKFLGGLTGMDKALESVEDKEDTEAAKMAQKELVQTDDADFEEKTASTTAEGTPSVPPTPGIDQRKVGDDSRGSSTPAGQDRGHMETETTLEVQRSSLTVPSGEKPKERPEPRHIDDYMIELIEWELQDVPVVPPVDKKKKRDRRGDRGRKR